MGTMLRNLFQGRRILCLREVRGPDGEVLHTMQHWLPNWRLVHSAVRSSDGVQCPDAGGGVTAICPRLHEMANVVRIVSVPGRCLGIIIGTGF